MNKEELRNVNNLKDLADLMSRFSQISALSGNGLNDQTITDFLEQAGRIVSKPIIDALEESDSLFAGLSMGETISVKEVYDNCLPIANAIKNYLDTIGEV
jgi:hypothetical protein